MGAEDAEGESSVGEAEGKGLIVLKVGFEDLVGEVLEEGEDDGFALTEGAFVDPILYTQSFKSLQTSLVNTPSLRNVKQLSVVPGFPEALLIEGSNAVWSVQIQESVRGGM